MNNGTLEKNKISRKEMTGWIVAVALFVVVMLIPVGEVFTQQIKLSIALTAAIMSGFAFEILPSVILGLMLLVLYIVTNLAPARYGFVWFYQPKCLGRCGGHAVGGVYGSDAGAEKGLLWLHAEAGR